MSINKHKNTTEKVIFDIEGRLSDIKEYRSGRENGEKEKVPVKLPDKKCSIVNKEGFVKSKKK